MTKPRTLVQRTLDELAERARTGEPEPGIYICGLCGREDGVQMFTVAEADSNEFTGRLICPCCSHGKCSHRDGQSRPQFPRC